MKTIWTIITLSVAVLLTQTAKAQVSVGYYDENMVFHYGSAPSTSSYNSYSYVPPAESSYYQGGYSGPSILETWMNDAYREANKMALDFNRDSLARQAEQIESGNNGNWMLPKEGLHGMLLFKSLRTNL